MPRGDGSGPDGQGPIGRGVGGRGRGGCGRGGGAGGGGNRGGGGACRRGVGGRANQMPPRRTAQQQQAPVTPDPQPQIEATIEDDTETE